MSDEWFDDFLGLDPDDLAEIAQDGEEALTEEQQRHKTMVAMVFFSADNAHKINMAIDDGDFEGLYASLEEIVKTLNATCRAHGWDPRSGERYER